GVEVGDTPGLSCIFDIGGGRAGADAAPGWGADAGGGGSGARAGCAGGRAADAGADAGGGGAAGGGAASAGAGARGEGGEPERGEGEGGDDEPIPQHLARVAPVGGEGERVDRVRQREPVGDHPQRLRHLIP